MNTQVWAAALQAAAKVLLAGGEQLNPALTRETKTATPTVTKTKKAAAVEVEETEDDELEELDEVEETGPTRESVLLAFKKYVQSFDDVKEGRNEAKKILKKFKVEQVSAILESDYEKVLKLLKA